MLALTLETLKKIYFNMMETIFTIDEAFEMSKIHFSKCIAVDMFYDDWNAYCLSIERKDMIESHLAIVPTCVVRPAINEVVDEVYVRLLEMKCAEHNINTDVNMLIEQIKTTCVMPF